MRTYSTKQIADIIGIHPNTVRFYEEIGFMSAPERKPNGYRVYTQLQLEQCRLIRLAMRAEVIQCGLRAQAVKTVKLCAALDMDGALAAAREYGDMIRREIKEARAAITAVERILEANEWDGAKSVRRGDAAAVLGVTPETLRTWERSGLIDVQRHENGYRAYSGKDMERLGIIRTLRTANYSLSSILRLLGALDSRRGGASLEAILNTPGENEDIISVCDRLIVSLNSTLSDAVDMARMIEKIKLEFCTLQ